MALLDGCLINENGADGVKYVHHDVKVIENRQENFDLCEFPTTASQTFPINVFVQQNLYSTKEQSCSKVHKSEKYFSDRNFNEPNQGSSYQSSE